IAKIIAHSATRTDAIRKLDYALSKTVLAGLRNNIGFLRRVLMSDEHLAGIISTRFLDEYPDLMREDTTVSPVVLIAASLARQQHTHHWRNNLNRALTYQFRVYDEIHTVHLNPRRDGSFTATVAGELSDVIVHSIQGTKLTLEVDGHLQKVQIIAHQSERYTVHTLDGDTNLQWISPLPVPGQREVSAGSLRSPMPGQVIQVAVNPGDSVQQGDLLLIVEAMKMEHRIEAPYAGVVETVFYAEGDSVQQDTILLDLNAEDPD
ncbi:MAG: biotin/lipoyl-containing protein, partial [Aggregatilineales bacterium]